MARLSYNIENPSTGHIVIFDQEILDTSNSYNPHIGVFRVPVSGVYCISLTAASQGEPGNGRVLHLHLKRDGTSVGYVFLDSDDLHWLRRNEIVILHLNVGDNVYVQVDIVHNHCTLNGDGLNTHLQGFLIFPY
ncbi:hypothetical protein FSP39_008429 [Pinctada imbricata]|uniref:C1q domain-containing protein n=1 Tax=Pinctada imbricata TaxID=66713 RepID=A0AA88XI51_PINIB|nr:hypothetical protein FSP39_008429 [Pinctada imbricata]